MGGGRGRSHGLLVAILARTALPMALLGGGCGEPVELEDRRCPCLEEAGFTCCKRLDLCLPQSAVCDERDPVAAERPDAMIADQQNAAVADHPDAADHPDSDAPAPEPSCGVPGQRCCPGNSCMNGGCCVRGVCAAFGEVCGPGTSCVSPGSCGGSGAFSQRCLEDGTCTAARTTCWQDPTRWICVACGGKGQPCCADGFCDGAPAPDAGAGPGCSLRRWPLSRSEPDIILVLDRSSGMLAPVSGAMESRWAQFRQGIVAATVQSFAMRVHWGLKLFPTASVCDVSSTPEVLATPGSYHSIAGVLQSMQPATGPTGAPLAQAVRASASVQVGGQSVNPAYLVLMTAGQVSCPAGPPGEREASRAVEQAAAMGIPSFVVGAAGLDTPEGRLLDELALAGGRPIAGDARYFLVESQQDVRQALERIAGQLASCVWQLAARSLEPDFAAVMVDGIRLQRDRAHQQGWDWASDFRNIEVFGDSCEKLKDRSQAAVELIQGCPQVIP